MIPIPASHSHAHATRPILKIPVSREEKGSLGEIFVGPPFAPIGTVGLAQSPRERNRQGRLYFRLKEHGAVAETKGDGLGLGKKGRCKKLSTGP